MVPDKAGDMRANAVICYACGPVGTDAPCRYPAHRRALLVVLGLAADLGISRGSLREWVLRARARRGEEPVRPTTGSDAPRRRPPATADDEAAERIAQLEERVRKLEASEKKLTTERDILRKAAKYCAGKTHW
ncbi:hypothetical protein GCM10010156_73440 [Planobispora rosea]|uniref:Transposase n=1 Tax=Planobispora rosea TaxID=35762 RepID=A0A8J3SA84_PLARO|nr:hypothetical protein [Planobispora rosea]GGT05037.1 hypothetical protein GCM10010156_73440 [Planobispora rosea]GIH88851.1 hypothetical protein Pro02_72590 [Planobispora rosea]